MASITPSSVIAEAKGAVGNLVYSRNAYGSYVKARVTPTNPNTTRQQDWRARLAAAVAAWQAATLEEKLSYQAQADARNVHSRIGKWQKITAYNLFVRQQLLASKNGTEGTATNPVSVMNQRHTLIAMSASESVINLSIEGPVAIGDVLYSIYAGPPRGSGRLSFNPSTIILLTEAAELFDPFEIVDITTIYEAQFGSLTGQAGKLITVGIMTFSPVSGERSTKAFLTGQVQP